MTVESNALPSDGDQRWRDAKQVMICSHDAGGAEILSEWVLRNPEKHYRFLLKGPAATVFRRKIKDIVILETEEAYASLPATDFLLTGTSWASAMELECITQARERGVFSVAFLDHWSNYAGRFNCAGTQVYPDEIWTGDPEAMALARATFPDRVVREQANPYFEALRRSFADAPVGAGLKADESRLLYVCEPIAIDCAVVTITRSPVGYTEFDALAFFLDRIAAIVPAGNSFVVRVRQHPSEKPGKYEPAISRYRERLAIAVSAGTTLMEDCRWSTHVVGCESMAMVVGLLAGRQVISSIPPGGPDCCLPQKAILRLKDMVAL